MWIDAPNDSTVLRTVRPKRPKILERKYKFSKSANENVHFLLVSTSFRPSLIPARFIFLAFFFAPIFLFEFRSRSQASEESVIAGETLLSSNAQTNGELQLP